MKLQKIPLIFKVVSLYLLAAITYLSFSYIYSMQSQHTVAQTIAETTIKTNKLDEPVSGSPTHLAIDRLKIHIPVQNGRYDEKSGKWTLSRDNVYFATGTKRPNNTGGNTLIYGHNTDSVLGLTKRLVKGDEVVITTKNGHRFHYRYSGDSIVNPSDTTILAATSDKPRLTLLTCKGWFSENRRLMFFDFVGVSS